MTAKAIRSLWTTAQEHRSLVSTLACAAFFIALLSFLPSQPETTQDSAGFLQFVADRTAGYPTFLALIGRLAGGLSPLPFAQLAVLCGSTLLFSIAVGRLTGSLVCTLAALLLILGNYEVVKYCFRVMSDALFISLLAALLGCIMFWIASGRLAWMAATSALLGAAIAVRPAGQALMIMLPILYARLWYLHDRRLLTLGAMIAPSMAMALLSLAAYHQRHDTWNPASVLGLNLLGKSIAFVDGTEASSRPDLIAMVARLGTRYRERFVIGATWHDHALLAAPVYDNIRGQLASQAEEFGNSAAADHVMTALALEIIRAHKRAYLQNVAENDAALWYVPELMTPADAARIVPQIPAFAQTAGFLIEYNLTPRSWPVVAAVRFFQLSALLVSLVFLVALPLQLIRFHKPGEIFWLGFAASAALHLSVLLIAAVNETKPRLMLDNWPLLVLLVVLALGWLARYWANAPATASSI